MGNLPPTAAGSVSRSAAVAREVHARLAAALPDPRVELDFADAWQLLVATILAAQSTDKLVNTVTCKAASNALFAGRTSEPKRCDANAAMHHHGRAAAVTSGAGRAARSCCDPLEPRVSGA